MLENYNLEKCRYMLGSLKPFIYVLPKETTRIDYVVDNYPIVINNATAYVGKCEVRNIYATNIVKIEGFKAIANVTEMVLLTLIPMSWAASRSSEDAQRIADIMPPRKMEVRKENARGQYKGADRQCAPPDR